MATCECIYCGRYFTPAESIAKNTELGFETTYCSLQHQDLHQEEMLASRTEEFKDIPEHDQAAATETKTINVAGFQLKVRK